MAGVQSSGADRQYRLQNDGLEIEFGACGEVCHLVDRNIGRDYIAKPGKRQRPLFVLHCVEMLHGRILPGEIPLASFLADSVIVAESEQMLSFGFRGIDGRDLDVSCLVTLEAEEPFVGFHLKLRSGAPVAIRSIEFPFLALTPQLGLSLDDDRILLPKEDGQLLGNPSYLAWEREGCRGDDQRYFYPGEGRESPQGLSAQLLAYYDGGGGLYIATHDGAGNVKKLGPIWRHGEGEDNIDFTPVHWFPEVACDSLEIPYETVAGFFSGNWQDAADIYKRWALGQPWCSRRLADRADIPGWIKNGAFFINFRLRFQEGGDSFLDRVPEFLNRWQVAIGAPLVAMMCGWEKIGEWAGPDYFPPYGGHERFWRMCRALRKLGIRPFPFGLSGLKLLLRRKITAASPQPELEIDYDAWETFTGDYADSAVREIGGGVLLDSQVDTWDGIHAYACVATDQARSQLHGASLHLVETYGVQVSQADQVLGGSTPACYSPSHGHDPGRGAWQVEALRRIYDDTRRDCKNIDPDFALSQEWISEPFIQALDIYHGRNYDQPRGLVGVPLFSYLYHEFLPCYGGDWMSFLPDNPCGVYYHAVNLVNGNLPAGCPQSMFASVRNTFPEDADPAILRMARNAAAVFLAFPEFFAVGEMQRTSALEVPTVTVRFIGLPFGWTRRPLTVPSVLHGGWKSPAETIAYVFANISTDTQSFPFRVESRVSEGPVALSLSMNGQKEESMASAVRLPQIVNLTLDPQDAVLLVVTPT
jgi:hypothetical protein